MKKTFRCGSRAGFFSALSLCAALSIFLMAPPAAEASWLFDFRALAERDDNVTSTNAATGMKAGTAYIGAVSLGYFEQIALYTGASMNVELENASVAEYDKLSRLSGGLSLNVNHKLGVGPQAVRMNMRASYRVSDFKDNNRDVNTLLAGLTGSFWATERLNLLFGYEYDKGSPRETFFAHCGQDGKSMDCDPGDYSNPYDTSGSAVFARLSFLLTEVDNLIFEYRFRRGQVTIDFIPDAYLRASRTSLWYDAVFADFVAARYQADTSSFNVGLSREIYRQFSLNLDYLRMTTSTSWANYDNNVFRLGVAYAF